MVRMLINGDGALVVKKGFRQGPRSRRSRCYDPAARRETRAVTGVRDGLDGRLQAYCTRAFPELDGARVCNLLRMTGGMDHGMYAFDLDSGPAGDRRREALVLRMYPGARADAACAHEFHGMRRLHEAGYPVPRVMCHERDASIVGTPFMIMERIEGQLLGPSACISFLFILIVSLSRGRTAMHPNVAAMVQTGAFTRACDVLRERTGIRWVEVERALASHS
jgi:hypothetical protein